MIKCCRNCEERVVGCHAECERYKAEKAYHDEAIAALRAEKKAIGTMKDRRERTRTRWYKSL